MNNILVLGVGMDQLPALKAIRELGWSPIGFDGNPEAIGKAHVDNFECVDIRNPDLVEEKALYWNKKKGIQAVIAPAVEAGPSAGRVIDLLGLLGIGEREAIILTDKVERRNYFDQIGIPQPKWAEEVCEKAWGIFPCIIKPRDQMAAVGVKFIANQQELDNARDFDIIEEYLEGWEISTEILVFPDQNCILAHADRNYLEKLKYAPAVIENGCSFPSRISPEIQTKIGNIAQKIVYNLGLRSCACKADILVKDNVVYIIEFAARMGGGKLSSTMIPGVTGIDWWKCACQLACGIPIKELPKAEIKGKFSIQRYRFPPEGVKNHKERLSSVECFGQTYEEALGKCE